MSVKCAGGDVRGIGDAGMGGGQAGMPATCPRSSVDQQCFLGKALARFVQFAQHQPEQRRLQGSSAAHATFDVPRSYNMPQCSTQHATAAATEQRSAAQTGHRKGGRVEHQRVQGTHRSTALSVSSESIIRTLNSVPSP